MTHVSYPGIGGIGTIDTARLLIDPAGNGWLRGPGDGPDQARLVPLSPEQVSALSGQFGADWSTAISAMQALS